MVNHSERIESLKGLPLEPALDILASIMTKWYDEKSLFLTLSLIRKRKRKLNDDKHRKLTPRLVRSSIAAFIIPLNSLITTTTQTPTGQTVQRMRS